MESTLTLRPTQTSPQIRDTEHISPPADSSTSAARARADALLYAGDTDQESVHDGRKGEGYLERLSNVKSTYWEVLFLVQTMCFE